MSASDTPFLVAHLAAERGVWQSLLATMRDEEHALVEGDADRLTQLNPAKLAQLQSVAQHARNRHDRLLAAGLTPDRAGMDTWMARHGDAGYLAEWRQLCALEEEAQAMNQRIGALIEMRLGTTRQALNVLLHAATGQNGLYDQAGQSVAARNGKPLTAA